MAGSTGPVEDDVQAVAWLVRGGWVSHCVRAMAELGLADVLAAPATVDEMARTTSTAADPLRRLLRSLADAGLLASDGADRYRLTSRGEVLRRDHPSGVRSLAMMQTWGPNTRAWSRLSDAVATGKGTFEAENGAPLWKTLSRHPEQQAVFNAAMARRADLQARTVRDACDLTGIGTVVDVGGGKGGLLASLLRDEPGLRGVLADRADVVAEAGEVFARAGIADRCQVRAADFFVDVPSGGDAYVLSNILHDWPDEDCRRILATVRAAMSPGARLWVLERVLDPDPPRPAEVQAELHLLDLNMLVLFGARERTRREYADLLGDAGFSAPVVHSPSPDLDVVEARHGEQ